MPKVHINQSLDNLAPDFTKEDGLYNIGGTGNLYLIFLFEMDQTQHYPLKCCVVLGIRILRID
jgi:hypothetical protein